MKMQHVAATPRAGRVVRLLASPGAFVRAGQPLAELAPDEA
jgi:biotin carboxyl carrier protein